MPPKKAPKNELEQKHKRLLEIQISPKKELKELNIEERYKKLEQKKEALKLKKLEEKEEKRAEREELKRMKAIEAEKKKAEEKEKAKNMRIYYGALPVVPKGYRRATMVEAVKANKVFYFGARKVDSKLIQSKKQVKNVSNEKKKLMGKYVSLRGKITKLDRDIVIHKKDPKKVEQFKADIIKTKKEINALIDVLREKKFI